MFPNVAKGGLVVGGAGGSGFVLEKGKWTMAAQVSAVALSSGASANAKYKEGVAVFTLTKAGACS